MKFFNFTWTFRVHLQGVIFCFVSSCVHCTFSVLLSIASVLSRKWHYFTELKLTSVRMAAWQVWMLSKNRSGCASSPVSWEPQHHGAKDLWRCKLISQLTKEVLGVWHKVSWHLGNRTCPMVFHIISKWHQKHRQRSSDDLLHHLIPWVHKEGK